MAKANIHSVGGNETVELASQNISYDEKTKVIEIILSERNLLSLLAKLHINGSKKTIYNGDVPDSYILKLVAEDDETHYIDREPPGAMAPETEVLVRALKKTLDTYERDHKIVQLFKRGAEINQGEEAS